MCFLVLLRMSAQIYAFCSIQLYIIFGHVEVFFSLTFRQMYVIDVIQKVYCLLNHLLLFPEHTSLL